MALKIGDLAKATGTKPNTIRFYEEIGLLSAPGRTEGNYRAYTREHLRRLAFVRRSRDIGLGLDQVRELLDLADHKDRSCASVEAIARAHRAAIERKIAGLQALDRELERMIDRCGHGTVAECGILEALAPRTTGPGALG
jgi:Cu(I)-responsive transcriptional regulator